MRTDDFRPSDNVEDDREMSASRGGISGWRSRRPRHRHDYYHRAGQLVLRDRSERAPQRRANSHQRIAFGANQSGPAGILRDADRRDRQVRRPGAWRYRGPLDGNFRRRRANLSPAEASFVRALRADALRLRAVGDGTVLLPPRPPHLSGHLVLRRPAAQVRRLCEQQCLQVFGSLRDRA